MPQGRPHPFRFGLTLYPRMSERRTWVDSVKRAEANGFSIVTVCDHFGRSGGVWSSLVSAADAAPSIRVGTLVLCNDLWNPMMVAREAITTDVLTDGRFELGIGAGWDRSDYESTGVPQLSPAARIEKLDEALSVIRPTLNGEAVCFEGTYYSARTGKDRPRSQQECLPILVGGGGRRILELAARKADIVSIYRDLRRGRGASWADEARASGASGDRTSERVQRIRATAAERFGRLELHALLLRVVITDRRREVADELGSLVGLAPDEILASPHFLAGTVDEVARDLEERRARWGISYWTLAEARDADAFAAVLRRLAGT